MNRISKLIQEYLGVLETDTMTFKHKHCHSTAANQWHVFHLVTYSGIFLTIQTFTHFSRFSRKGAVSPWCLQGRGATWYGWPSKEAHFNPPSFQCLNYYCGCFLFRIGSLQAVAAKLHLSSSLNKSSTTVGMADSGVARASEVRSPFLWVELDPLYNRILVVSSGNPHIKNQLDPRRLATIHQRHTDTQQPTGHTEPLSRSTETPRSGAYC